MWQILQLSFLHAFNRIDMLLVWKFGQKCLIILAIHIPRVTYTLRAMSCRNRFKELLWEHSIKLKAQSTIKWHFLPLLQTLLMRLALISCTWLQFKPLRLVPGSEILRKYLRFCCPIVVTGCHAVL